MSDSAASNPQSRWQSPVLDAVSGGICAVDDDGRAIYVNPAACRLLGRTPEEVLGRSLHDLIHHHRPDGSDYPESECPRHRASADAESECVEDECFFRADGSSFEVEYTWTPLSAVDGGGAVLSFRDITQRRQRQRELAALQRRNEQILQSAGEGIYGLDCKGHTTFVNRAAAEMLGWRREDLVDRVQHNVIHHSHANGKRYEAQNCPIYAAFHDGEVHRVDREVFWRKDGTNIPVEYVSTPIFDEDGELEGAVVTFQDITERKLQQTALENALEEVQRLKDRLQEENLYLQQEIQVSHNFHEIIGSSEALTKTLHRMEQVAGTDATVLLLGETGVGKELFARGIHHLSRRHERPLVKVNCAALPSNLIESELFGHEKAAFTGATERRIGRFELADGGTIFLDEVGELPLDLQPKLLRVLQEGEFERLGGSQTISVDVRVIAATNRDLTKAVWAGEFRDDLYYRLNVFPVDVPPLREREGDLPQLVRFFVEKYAKKLGRRIDHIPDEVERALERYDWPGNIRELENVIERGVILSTDGILRVDEALEMREPMDLRHAAARTLESVEREHIEAVLDQTSWRIEGKQGAATILGLHPNTLRSRMKKMGIQRPG